jgi:SAM-dependent methyltransferase
MSTSPLATPLPWNLVAEAYATDITPVFEGYASFALDQAGLPAGASVVDVGCGPGTLSLLAARRGLRVRALDFAAQMVDLLADRLAAEPLLEVEPVVGDGMALPWPDDCVDGGFSMFALFVFPDPVAGLRELRRVVRPGGPVVFSSWPAMRGVPALDALFSGLATLLPGGPPPVPPALSTPEEIDQAVMDAGLVPVARFVQTHSLRAPDPVAWFEGLERTMAPVVLLRHSLGPRWPALRANLLGHMLAAMPPGPVEVEMAAHITVARVPVDAGGDRR